MLGRFFCGTNISENLHFNRLKGVRWIYEVENGLDEGWSVRKPKNEWLEGPSVDILLYFVAGFQESDMDCNLLVSQSERVLGFKTVFMGYRVEKPVEADTSYLPNNMSGG